MCGRTVAKVILILCNVIFFLTGAVLLAVGIWAKVDGDSLTAALSSVVGAAGTNTGTLLEIAGYVLIATGILIIIIGFFGCCGAIKESRVLLSLYIAIIIIIIILEIAIAVLGIIFRQKIEDELKTRLQMSLKNNYTTGAIIKDDKVEFPDDSITFSWDLVQFQLECCGFSSFGDYQKSAVDEWDEKIVINGNSQSSAVPLSCCKLKAGKTGSLKTTKSDFLDIDDCIDGDTDAVNVMGCYERGIDFIKSRAEIFIGICIGIAILEILVLIAAIYLCVIIGREK